MTNRINLIESFQDFKEAENIDRPTLMKVLEDVFKTLLRKKYGSDDNFDVIVNDKTGDLEIFRRREIVEDGFVEDELAQVDYSEAIKIEPDYAVGEELYEEVDVLNFGRRAILAAKQTLAARISDLKKNSIVNKYADKVGELQTAEVYQVWRKELMLVDDENNELLLQKGDQIPGDFFKKGETCRAVIKKVEMRNNNPIIMLSRTHTSFLHKLLELEVPEIAEGIITIRKIVRQPGERAKVAVESFDERIDPVGACVGMKGSRIHGIVRELRNENIDVINFTNNTQLYIQRALTPAKVNRIDINEETKHADVFMDTDQVSLAIGKKGVNIKLAQMLTGYTIDVYRDVNDYADYDIDLDEFTDEIDQWVIDEFKKIGCDTALSILNLSIDELVRRTDLEVETVKDVRKILEDEFENEAEEEEEDKEDENIDTKTDDAEDNENTEETTAPAKEEDETNQ